MTYSIQIEPDVWRVLMKLDEETQDRVFNAIYRLEAAPRPSGCKKLREYGGLFRIRVGDFRVIYDVQDAVLAVLIVGIGNRKPSMSDGNKLRVLDFQWLSWCDPQRPQRGLRLMKNLVLALCALSPRLATAQEVKTPVVPERVPYSRAILKGLRAFVPRVGNGEWITE